MWECTKYLTFAFTENWLLWVILLGSPCIPGAGLMDKRPVRSPYYLPGGQSTPEITSNPATLCPRLPDCDFWSPIYTLELTSALQDRAQEVSPISLLWVHWLKVLFLLSPQLDSLIVLLGQAAELSLMVRQSQGLHRHSPGTISL